MANLFVSFPLSALVLICLLKGFLVPGVSFTCLTDIFADNAPWKACPVPTQDQEPSHFPKPLHTASHHSPPQVGTS